MLFVVVETVKKLLSYNHPRMSKYRWNPQILVDLLLLTYRGAVVAMRRHLDCNTYSLLVWVWVAHRRIGHA
jgi:hypothetical protein